MNFKQDKYRKHPVLIPVSVKHHTLPCNPAAETPPNLVLRRVIFPSVLFSGGMSGKDKCGPSKGGFLNNMLCS